MRHGALRLDRSQDASLTTPYARTRRHRDLGTIARAALEAASPSRLVPRLCAAHGELAGLPPHSVIAAGKAARSLLDAWRSSQPGSCRDGLIAASETLPATRGFSIYRAGHPVPDAGSVAAGGAALAMARALGRDDTLVVLLSGGASSHLAVPADGIELAEKVTVTRLLLNAGASIEELNAVRKHLSALKGGWLGAATAARVVTLALSDVTGDDPSVIASGPTVGDPSTWSTAWRAIVDRGLEGRVPAAIVGRLRRGLAGRLEDTPKPGDPRLDRCTWYLAGNAADATREARQAAERLGYDAAVLPDPLTGLAREAGERLVSRALERARTLRRPACVVSFGETVVRVTGPGRGGRNQEVALSAAVAIDSSAEEIALASLGTDGIDGPTDAAGAIADSTTLARARQRGLSPPERWLARNDSYTFFRTLDDLIVTGPTGTNVADLQIVLLG